MVAELKAVDACDPFLSLSRCLACSQFGIKVELDDESTVDEQTNDLSMGTASPGSPASTSTSFVQISTMIQI